MEIKVKVYAPAFISHELINEGGFILLEEGTCVKELFSILKIPLWLRWPSFCAVNYDQANLETKLQDGDTVSFVFPLSGG